MFLSRLIALCAMPILLSGCFTAVVGGTAAVSSGIHDQRSVGTQIDDVALTTKIDARLIAETDMPSRWISVQVINGKATLTGHLPTERHIQRAIYITESISGVISVHSELLVGKPEIGAIMSDSWITAQIKTKFWNDELVSGFSIKVETVEGKVYLQGIVNDFIQRQRAKDIAMKVDGVTAIVDLMQVAAK